LLVGVCASTGNLASTVIAISRIQTGALLHCGIEAALRDQSGILAH
jgi:hypothetical protein